MEKGMMKVARLWKNKTKLGDEYFSGYFGEDVKIVVFKNKFKKDPKHHDFNVYFSENRKQEYAKKQSSENSDPFSWDGSSNDPKDNVKF